MISRIEVRAARARLGWSRDQLAEASDVPVSSIYLLERLGSAGEQDDKRILAALERAEVQRENATSFATSSTACDAAADLSAPAVQVQPAV